MQQFPGMHYAITYLHNSLYSDARYATRPLHDLKHTLEIRFQDSTEGNFPATSATTLHQLFLTTCIEMAKAVVVRYEVIIYQDYQNFGFLLKAMMPFSQFFNSSCFHKFNYLFTFYWSYDKMGVNKIHPNKRSCPCSHLQDFQLHTITILKFSERKS